MKSTVIDIEVLIVHRTEKAVLVKDTEDGEGIWLPLSQVEVSGDPGQIGTVTVPEWVAQERGLI